MDGILNMCIVFLPSVKVCYIGSRPIWLQAKVIKTFFFFKTFYEELDDVLSANVVNCNVVKKKIKIFTLNQL